MISLIRTTVVCVVLVHTSTAYAQTVAYEVLPESEFLYGFTDDNGEFQNISGNIKGLCRIELRQKHGDTTLIIDSLHMTTLTDPQITVIGGGHWNIGYGSASDIAKFGLQFAMFGVKAERGPGQLIATFLEPTVAQVEFP